MDGWTQTRMHKHTDRCRDKHPHMHTGTCMYADRHLVHQDHVGNPEWPFALHRELPGLFYVALVHIAVSAPSEITLTHNQRMCTTLTWWYCSCILRLSLRCLWSTASTADISLSWPEKALLVAGKNNGVQNVIWVTCLYLLLLLSQNSVAQLCVSQFVEMLQINIM